MKRVLMAFVSILLVVLFVSGVIAPGSTTSPVSQDYTCKDTDGGKDYYTKGKTYGLYWEDTINEGAQTYYDSCSKCDDNLENCEYVIENFCRDDGFVDSEEYNCPGGCEDGVCISEGECKDSDGGKDYYTKGVCSGNDYPKGVWDRCDSTPGSEAYVEDYYCYTEPEGPNEGYTHCITHSYLCPDGCEDGACVQKGEMITERIVCNFDGSGTMQKCYLAGSFSASDEGTKFCQGVQSCVINYKGYKGDKITWKSTCGGYQYTIMDGVKDEIMFNCGVQKPIEPVCGNGICEGGEGEICEVEAVECEEGEICETKKGNCYFRCEEDCKDIPYINGGYGEEFKLKLSQTIHFIDPKLEIKFNTVHIPKRCDDKDFVPPTDVTTTTSAGGVGETATIETEEKVRVIQSYGGITGNPIAQPPEVEVPVRDCTWRPSRDYGACEMFLGAYFNGENCVGLSGCSSDGDIPFATGEQCKKYCMGGTEPKPCVDGPETAVLQVKIYDGKKQKTEVIKLQITEKKQVFDMTIHFIDYNKNTKTGYFVVKKEEFFCPEECVCDSEGNKLECWVDVVDCPKGRKLCPDGTCRKTCKVGDITECNFGCFYEDKCLPYGLRVEGLYCDISDDMKTQLTGGETCDNNFECVSNVCVDGECISSGFLRRVISWFRRVFDRE
jgi:hypothetical protein